MVAAMARYWVRARIPPMGTNTLRCANLVRLMCQLFQKSWGLVFRYGLLKFGARRKPNTRAHPMAMSEKPEKLK